MQLDCVFRYRLEIVHANWKERFSFPIYALVLIHYDLGQTIWRHIWHRVLGADQVPDLFVTRIDIHMQTSSNYHFYMSQRMANQQNDMGNEDSDQPGHLRCALNW